jgi:ABC-type Zn uptake system ZnuABC Zn-binding protein ZnuA
MGKRLLRCRRLALVSFLLSSACILGPALQSQGAAPALQVCATVPDLGALVNEVGGDRVFVMVFAKGPEDPHFLDAKPGFIKALSQADLYIQTGMDLELGWAPVLLKNARNARVLPGARGFVDASTVIGPLEVPTGPVDRSMGDVHPTGNPHYLLDPLNGLGVARLIRDRLSQLVPEGAAYFEERFMAFQRRMGDALVGEKLARKYDPEKLAILYQHGKLEGFLKEQGEAGLLEGWLGLMLPHFGAKAVADHNLWPYFATRFGISIVAYLEPKPGVSPTTRHLGEVVETMRKEGIHVLLTSPYFDPRPARFISEKTGARIVRMAHQTGALDGTGDYIRMVDFNVRLLSETLSSIR